MARTSVHGPQATPKPTLTGYDQQVTGGTPWSTPGYSENWGQSPRS